GCSCGSTRGTLRARSTRDSASRSRLNPMAPCTWPGHRRARRGDTCPMAMTGWRYRLCPPPHGNRTMTRLLAALLLLAQPFVAHAQPACPSGESFDQARAVVADLQRIVTPAGVQDLYAE